jgi:hypothetical protein
MNWKTGLDYGWWRDPNVWALIAWILIGVPVIAAILFGWYADGKPWW